MNKCYGSDQTLLLMTRQIPTLSVGNILAQTQESFPHTGLITEQVPLGCRTYSLFPVNLQASVLTNNEGNLLAMWLASEDSLTISSKCLYN